MRLTKAREGWLVGALLGALLAAGCGTSKPETSRGAAAQQPPPVQAAAAAPSSDAIEIQTVLSVEREVDVLAQRDGVVEEILHDQGARVEKGASLARLDDRQLLAELDKARADLEVARNNVKYNEEEVKARQAAYRRAQEMFKERLNSQADLEEAEFRAKGAQYDLESWRATVTRTEAEIRLLELELEKTQIRAPFGGVVARRYIRPGQNVVKDDKCFRLSQLAPLLVHFLVPETAPRRPKLGDVVTVAPLSDTQRVYVARVQQVSPTVDAASGSYDVTAVLTGADLEELRPGMGVKVIWGAAAGSR
jgi:RND family efflux transporter MFP subunit